jgi:hypothetical protein
VADINFINTKIDLGNEYEFDVWLLLFNCKKEELLHAINTVGNSASEVKDYIKMHQKNKPL